MKQKFTTSIWQEDEWFVAQMREVDVASQGKSEDEALENLRDALEALRAARRYVSPRKTWYDSDQR